MQRRELLKLMAGQCHFIAGFGAAGQLMDDLAAPAGRRRRQAAGRVPARCLRLHQPCWCPTASDFYYASRPNHRHRATRWGRPHGALSPCSTIFKPLTGACTPRWPRAGDDRCSSTSRRRPSSPSPAPRPHAAATSKRRTTIELGPSDIDRRRTRLDRSGFLNRLAGVLGAGPVADVSPIAFTDQLPIALTRQRQGREHGAGRAWHRGRHRARQGSQVINGHVPQHAAGPAGEGRGSSPESEGHAQAVTDKPRWMRPAAMQ